MFTEAYRDSGRAGFFRFAETEFILPRCFSLKHHPLSNLKIFEMSEKKKMLHASPHSQKNDTFVSHFMKGV